jgi:hypothetical protein
VLLGLIPATGVFLTVITCVAMTCEHPIKASVIVTLIVTAPAKPYSTVLEPVEVGDEGKNALNGTDVPHV